MLASALMDRLESEVKSSKRAKDQAENHYESLRSQIKSTENDIKNTLDRFAQLRLDAGVPIQFDAVNAILSQRNNRLSSYHQKKADCEQQIVRREAELDALLSRQQSFSAKASDAYAKSPDYQQAKSRVNELDTRLAWLEGVREDILAECDRKLPEYLSSPLFVYLLRRRFLRSDYKSGVVTKHFDRWLANKIRFSENNENFQMLTQMKAVVDSRATEARELVEAAQANLQSLQLSIDKSVGLADISAEVARASKELASVVSMLDSVTSAINDHEANEDSHFRSAQHELASRLESLSIDALKQKALETDTPEDDALVRQLEDLQYALAKLDDELSEAKDDLSRLKKSHQRASDLLQGARSRSLDSSKYRYNSSLDLDGLVTGYMLGQINSSSVFSDMEHSRSRIPTPSSSSYSSSSSSDFGSGGFSSSSSFGSGGFDTTDSF